MKNFITLLTLLTLLAGTRDNCFAQTQWQRSSGGISDDCLESIIQTSDGGYAGAGTMNYDIYIVKLDGSGALQWSKTVGGPGIEFGYSITQTTDGGYAVAGHTSSFASGNGDMYIVKFDASGTLQWSRTVGGGTGEALAYSIIQTTDGGYAVAGFKEPFHAGLYDMYIVKLDGNGTLQWIRTVGGTESDIAYCIIQTTDGGFAVAGCTQSFGAANSNFHIVKLDGGGSLQWSRTAGGTGSGDAQSIIQTTDGGYAVAGYTESFGAGGGDMYIVKFDASGMLQWSRTVGGTQFDNAQSIIQTTDGGFAVAGYTESFGAGFYDMYIVKLDASGTLQWSRTIGGAGCHEGANSIIQTTDGGYAVAGRTCSFGAGGDDMYIVKLNASGNTCGNSTSPSSISGSGGTTTSPTPTVNSPTPTITSPSPTTSTGGTVTTICVIGIQPISNEIPSSFSLSQNYPNPFNPNTKIRFDVPKSEFITMKIFDALGREIETLVNEKLVPGTYEVDWNGTNYPSGVYFYRLTAGDFSETKKMVMIK